MFARCYIATCKTINEAGTLVFISNQRNFNMARDVFDPYEYFAEFAVSLPWSPMFAIKKMSADLLNCLELLSLDKS